jgi:opacity protein-like surface antigen
MCTRRILFALALFALATSVAVAAEAIKPDLKKFKWKGGFDGAEQYGGYDEGESRFFLYTFGTATGSVELPEDGDYLITIDASCDEAKKIFAAFKLTIGDVVVTKEQFLKSTEVKPYTFTAKLKKGKQDLVVEFLNDEFKEGEYDRNLYLHGIRLEKK